MKTIEEQKAELKAKMSEEIDKYYAEIEGKRKNKSQKIEEIERLLVEKKAAINAMMIESIGKAMSEEEAEKKSAASAGGE